ncbi:hypothetical protein [uncultured Paracoccus sp.]|uniref:hypothetical protein n=1 Tax=uncultured Paracoccus sp. TaxID=189685 RepID=UPI0026293FD6|nr:hypothetical protein [uncultured Paracoccus sp.]
MRHPHRRADHRAGTSDVEVPNDSGGISCGLQSTDEAKLWSAVSDRARALDEAMNRLAVLREAERMRADD